MVDISDGIVRKKVNFYVNCWAPVKFAGDKYSEIMENCTKTVEEGVRKQMKKEKKYEGIDFRIAEFTLVEPEK